MNETKEIEIGDVYETKNGSTTLTVIGIQPKTNEVEVRWGNGVEKWEGAGWLTTICNKVS